MQENYQNLITQPKKLPYLKLVYGLILCLFLIVTFAGGYWIGKAKINNRGGNIITTSPSTETAPKLEFKNNIDPSFILLTSPNFTKEIKGKSYEPLYCLRSSLDTDNKLTIDKIKASINDAVLISGLEKIRDNEYDYLARSYKEDGKTIDKEKVIKTKAEIDLYSVCKDQEALYVLYNANIPWSSIQNQLFSLIPPARAAGGPQYATVPYLAKVSQSGEVNFFKLGSDSTKTPFFHPISTAVLKQFGYVGERRTDMLFPEQILGKIGNDILATFETRCYECRDNPMERSLYSISLDSLGATELSFCRNYESPEQQCYDQQGLFASIK